MLGSKPRITYRVRSTRTLLCILTEPSPVTPSTFDWNTLTRPPIGVETYLAPDEDHDGDAEDGTTGFSSLDARVSAQPHDLQNIQIC